MAKYSIVIPTLIDVDKDYLKVCVESLRASGFDGQIIVVANGSKNSKPIQDGEIEGISTILFTPKQGQCNAVNLGAQFVAPDSKYIMVSNADMYYAPGWDKNLKFSFPVFSPNLVEPTNNHGSAPPFLKVDGGFTLDEFNQKTVDSFIKKEVSLKKNQYAEQGFNLPFFIRKDVWQAIEGYDTKYDPWGSNSDTDLQMKIELAGVLPKRVRSVLVYHFSNKSGTFDNSNQEYWWRNWNYLEQKWGFNRDQAGSDTWYHQRMIDYDKLKYHPEWEGRYEA